MVTVSSSGDPVARVLIVDDDPSLVAAFKRYLGRRHIVETATSGQLALELLASGARFDIVLCDLQMPVLGGIQLYRLLLNHHPDQAQRVVFMTGGDHQSTEFHDEVPVRCLGKPVALDELSSVVALAARGRLPRHNREG
jgi:CheY-like chemotaxis protein